jgi:hypothetical protein
MIGVNLRSASIAAKFALNPDIDRVNNSDLVKLRDLLGVDDITLFKKTEHDIVGQKSSDPKEINVSSKDWGFYYTAFQQLLNKQKVEVGTGQVLPGFWTAPMDTSSTDTSHVDKWGYYYDGTTNYIIDPFVHDSTIRAYQQLTGIEDTLNQLVKNNKDFALEMSVINTDKYLGKLGSSPNQGTDWFSQREVLFGEYNYRDSDDKTYIEEALQTNKTVFYNMKVNGKEIVKSFAPIRSSYLKYTPKQSPMMIEIAADYSAIQTTLHRQLQKTFMFMIAASLIAVLIIYTTLWIARRGNEQAALHVQETYVDNVENLFLSMKEQRHDFNNHIATIAGMLQMNHYAEVREYTRSLVGETKAINDILNINNPALCALVQAKMAVAATSHITFEHDFRNMSHVVIKTVKATDLVKILSNLIDNAFDAVKLIDDPKRHYVSIKGEVVGPQLQFTVTNKGPQIEPALQQRIFESGFSTKEQTKNSGMGLAIVRKLVASYKGSINLTSEADVTSFEVAVPL